MFISTNETCQLRKRRVLRTTRETKKRKRGRLDIRVKGTRGFGSVMSLFLAPNVEKQVFNTEQPRAM